MSVTHYTYPLEHSWLALCTPRILWGVGGRFESTALSAEGSIKVAEDLSHVDSSGAVWESRWTSWAVRPNEPSGFRGRKELLNRASALVTTCP